MLKRLRMVYAVLFGGILLVEIGIALFVHDAFVRPYIGDMLVTVLLCCFCRIFVPQKVTLLPAYVFLFAVAVELLQYVDIVQLLGLQNSRFLSVLVGRTFSAADIFCYALGCLAFFAADRIIRKHCVSPTN